MGLARGPSPNTGVLRCRERACPLFQQVVRGSEMMRAVKTFCTLLTAFLAVRAYGDEWKPADGPLTTPWTKDVSPDNALPEYPRPQMVRQQWQNLNGLWDYAVQPKEQAQPKEWQGKI